ncbi:MAG: hypothetical protein IJX97_06020 [Clostridia bacterium]|nr:hypothetical protein [Clostridia bacterium]
MKNHKKILFGVVLLIAGVIILLNSLGVTDINIWFPGWWTLFIIIPCVVGIFTERDKTGNIVGLIIGVSLLLWQLDVVDLSILWKILVPAIVIAIAIKMIINGFGRKKQENIVIVSGDVPAGTAIFGGKDMNFDGQVFEGCELTAIFGGVDCDLSGAIIEKDCRINATAIFGGIEIIVPKGVKVKVDSTNIFGGTSDESDLSADSEPTIYIESVSIFGGVDIR